MHPGTRLLREEAYRRRESLCWGLTGDQLMDHDEMNNGHCSVLIVRRPQLTWRVIGHAEELGLRIENLSAVVDDVTEIVVVWRGLPNDELCASIEAWREAERHLNLPRRAQHYVRLKEARGQTVQPAAA